MNPAAQAEFAAALLDPGHPGPAGLRAWNGSDPTVRLAVHRNNVVSSLIDGLADTFPVVQTLVGPEFFRAMAAVFVRLSPPRSPLLAFYGADFPPFVADFGPASGLPYLADVARLELARVHAYHAADAAVMTPADCAAVSSTREDVGALRFGLHPSARLVVSTHAVVSLWAAHQQDEVDLSGIALERHESALVLRVGLDVLVLPLPPGGASFTAALLAGQPLARAVDLARTAVADFDSAAVLSLLIGHGAVVSMS